MNLAESRHGGDIFGFADEEQENVLDFSININPVGLSPLGEKEITYISGNRYSSLP